MSLWTPPTTFRRDYRNQGAPWNDLAAYQPPQVAAYPPTWIAGIRPGMASVGFAYAFGALVDRDVCCAHVQQATPF